MCVATYYVQCCDAVAGPLMQLGLVTAVGYQQRRYGRVVRFLLCGHTYVFCVRLGNVYMLPAPQVQRGRHRNVAVEAGSVEGQRYGRPLTRGGKIGVRKVGVRGSLECTLIIGARVAVNGCAELGLVQCQCREVIDARGSELGRGSRHVGRLWVGHGGAVCARYQLLYFSMSAALL